VSHAQSLHFDTLAIRAGQHRSNECEHGDPIFATSSFVFKNAAEAASRFMDNAPGNVYSRFTNPTVRAFADRLAALEDAEWAIATASGMYAIQMVAQSLLRAGDHAIVSDVAYGGTYRLCTKIFTRFGVEFTFADTSNADDVRKSLRDNTRLILTETPANPTLKLTDIRAISDIATEKSIPHAVDNTFLTPFYQRPLELGADIVIHSTTKYFDGHNATVGGAVVSKDKRWDDAIRFVQNATGVIMSPWVAWLTLQGVKTLSVRMERQSANAQAVAEFLERHAKVRQVCYPGLESFSQHALAKRQATGFGAMLWFEVEGGVEAGKRLMDGVELCSLAENLGSVETLITHPVTMTHADVEPAERARVGITDGLVRLSVGLEDAQDIIDDLARALEAV